MSASDPLLAPMDGADHRTIGGVEMDTVRAGDSRVRRLIYPPRFRWSTNIKPLVGTDLCMHAHVGFLARGQMGVRFADGCTREFKAPQVMVIEPGHEGWVMGDEPAVLIEFDFERDTIEKIGLPAEHQHSR